MSRAAIRDARLPDDAAVLAGFVEALQYFEHAFEPDRRVDAAAGEDYLQVLLERVRTRNGRIFVADGPDGAVGWAVFHEDDAPNYVVSRERRYGYIAELYVDAHARGQGIGRALMAACEAHARQRGLALLMIGVHTGNARAQSVYRRAGFSPYSLQLRKYLD